MLDASVLGAMPTKVLLGRLRRLLRCEESSEFSDASPDEIAETVGIVFKNTPEWELAHGEVKAALAARAHVLRAPERRALRGTRAAVARTAEHRRRR